MGDAKDHPTFFYRLDQSLGLFAGVDHRLVHNHVETRLNKGHGRFKVGVVGGDDGDKVNPFSFGQSAFLFQHLLPGAVIPFRRQEQVFAR